MGRVNIGRCKQSNGGEHRADIEPIPVLGLPAVHRNGEPTGGGKGCGFNWFASAGMRLNTEVFDLVNNCVNF